MQLPGVDLAVALIVVLGVIALILVLAYQVIERPEE